MNKELLDILKNTRPSWEKAEQTTFDKFQSKVKSIEIEIENLLAKKQTESFSITSETTEDKKRVLQLPPDPDVPDTLQIGEDLIPDHPWRIRIRTIPETDPPEYEYLVMEGTLYTGIGSWDNIAVDGVDEWNAAENGNIILFGEVVNGACANASIKNESTLPDRIVYDDLNQTEFNTIIGNLSIIGGSISLKQNAFQDFTLSQFCVDSKPAIYPIST
jgi:hypothetical protein